MTEGFLGLCTGREFGAAVFVVDFVHKDAITSAFLHLMKMDPALPERCDERSPASRRPGTHRRLLQRFVQIFVVEQAHPQIAVVGSVVDPTDRQIEVEG